jgi:hypothetical protein
MSDKNMPEYSNAEGLALALHYLNDPSDVPCPTCGPETMEVVAYLDVNGIQEGVVRPSDPDGDYTVVLYCHECRRAAALDLSPQSCGDDNEDRRAA